jgi:TRAP-type C4-dicarboxylate transport system permease small subunit
LYLFRSWGGCWTVHAVWSAWNHWDCWFRRSLKSPVSFSSAHPFLALAGTLRNGDHIRVSILLQGVGPAVARLLNIWALAVAFALAAFFTWHALALVLDSYRYNEVSFGIIPIPLMFPQAVMTLGLFVLAIALLR